MNGFPITYGDSLDSKEAGSNLVSFLKHMVVYSLVIISTTAVALAADKVGGSNSNELAKTQDGPMQTVDKTVTVLSCIGAGSACREPGTKASLVLCSVLLTWCLCRSFKCP
jgi:hypothetical protein